MASLDYVCADQRFEEGIAPRTHIRCFFLQVRMLDLISEYCEFRNYPYERLDGRIRGSERQKAIDRFEREESSFVFLLSTRAGGVGINLTAAGKCIPYTCRTTDATHSVLPLPATRFRHLYLVRLGLEPAERCASSSAVSPYRANQGRSHLPPCYQPQF